MSRNDEPVNPAFVVAVARQILDHHDKGGTCQRCTPADCDQTVWALQQIAEHHARRAGVGVRALTGVHTVQA